MDDILTQPAQSLDSRPVGQRLARFLADWRAIETRQSLEKRLPRLMAKLAPMLRSDRLTIATATNSSIAPLKFTRLATAVTALAPMLSKMRQEGGEINVWQLAGLKRAEVRNAAVLAAMWAPGTLGDRAAAFLNNFLRRLSSGDELPSRNELARGYIVRTEHCATGAATERVDITVEGKSFVLAVEVKIDAGEGPQQLARYRQSVEDWARIRGKRGAVVLLAPFRTPVPGIVQADWRDIVAAARSILPHKRSAFTHAERLLDDFAQHVVAFQGTKK